MRTQFKKVIWALDPFEDMNETQNNVFQNLQLFSKSLSPETNLSILPIYILSPDQFNLPKLYASQIINQYQTTAQKALEQRMIQLRQLSANTSTSKNIPELQASKVLVHHPLSLRSLVQYFIQFSESENADFIVVGTHTRKGLARFFLGSFAEALLIQSTIPVLISGASSEYQLNFGQILYPCSLEGQANNPVFSYIVQLAHQMKSKINLLHTISRPLEPVLQSGGYFLSGAWPDIPNFLEDQQSKLESHALEWKKTATEQGVELQTTIDVNSMSIAESILQMARRHQVGLITIEATSGPIRSAILGSVTRQIARSAPCPVLVLKSGNAQPSA